MPIVRGYLGGLLMRCPFCNEELPYDRCSETGRTVYFQCDCDGSHVELDGRSVSYPVSAFLDPNYSPFANEINPVTGLPFEDPFSEEDAA